MHLPSKLLPSARPAAPRTGYSAQPAWLQAELARLLLAPLLAPLFALSLALLLAGPPAQAATEVSPTARAIELQFRAGERQLAQQRLVEALASKPADPALRFLQGVLLSESGQSAAAVSAFERMTEEFPDLPEPYNNLAVLQAAAGQLDRARSLLETALKLDPAYHTAHENLGDVFVRLAQRAFEAAAASPRAEPALRNKLRLARELAATR